MSNLLNFLSTFPSLPRTLLTLVVGALAFAAGAGGTTYALSLSTGRAPAALSTTSLYSPTGLGVTQRGSNLVLSWTAPNPHRGNGYAIFGVDNGLNPGCPATAAAYTTFVGGTAAGATTYSDATSAVAGAADGHRVCYLVQDAFNPAGPPPWGAPPPWTSVNTLATAGLAVRQITLVQAGPESSYGRRAVKATLGAGTVSGHLLVASVASDVSGISGPSGWVRAVSTSNAVAGNVEIWYRRNVPAGVGTARFTCGACSVMVAQMSEFKGASTTAPADATGSMSDPSGGSATAAVATGASTAGSYDLAVSAFVTTGNGSFTAGAGWTNLVSDPAGFVSDYQLLNPRGVVGEVETADVPVAWVGVVATFQR